MSSEFIPAVPCDRVHFFLLLFLWLYSIPLYGYVALYLLIQMDSLTSDHDSF